MCSYPTSFVLEQSGRCRATCNDRSAPRHTPRSRAQCLCARRPGTGSTWHQDIPRGRERSACALDGGALGAHGTKTYPAVESPVPVRSTAGHWKHMAPSHTPRSRAQCLCARRRGTGSTWRQDIPRGQETSACALDAGAMGTHGTETYPAVERRVAPRSWEHMAPRHTPLSRGVLLRARRQGTEEICKGRWAPRQALRGREPVGARCGKSRYTQRQMRARDRLLKEEIARPTSPPHWALDSGWPIWARESMVSGCGLELFLATGV